VIDLIATGSGYQLHFGDRAVEIGGTPAELTTALAALPRAAAPTAPADDSALAGAS
jgi:hypothetical protein